MSNSDRVSALTDLGQGIGEPNPQSMTAACLASANSPFDSLHLHVRGMEIDVLTGIYSEETLQPQPLRIDVEVELALPSERFVPETALAASKNYMDIKATVRECALMNTHFTLIEAVAEHICAKLLSQDPRTLRVVVTIVKLAISTNGEEIGIKLVRGR